MEHDKNCKAKYDCAGCSHLNNMKVNKYFKVGANNIGWLGDSFKDNFLDMDFEISNNLELKTLKMKVLERDMTDQEILSEWKPKESNLGELVYALENDILSKNGYANIFYIRDSKNVLWAVRAFWFSDRRYWLVGAYPVGYPVRWGVGYQVLSCDFNFETKTSEVLTLKLSDTVKVVEIEYLGNKYRLVS